MIVIKFYVRHKKEVNLVSERLKYDVKDFFINVEFFEDIDYVDLDENEFYDIEKENFFKAQDCNVDKEKFYKIDLEQFTYWGFILKDDKDVREKLEIFLENRKKENICLIIGYKEIEKFEEITDFYKNFAEYIDEKINMIEAMPSFIKPIQCEIVEF
ncbi:hypothetical protein [Persephonella sp.]